MIGHRRGLEHLTFSLRRGADAKRRRLRLPKVRVRRWSVHRWAKVARKVPFLVDPVRRELVRWAWPKHPQLTRTP